MAAVRAESLRSGHCRHSYRPFGTPLTAVQFCMLTAVGVTLDEISDENRAAVLALRVAPGQEQFVSSVRESLAEAAAYPHARPWYRTVVAGGTPVGFVMMSWNAEPQPPEIVGPSTQEVKDTRSGGRFPRKRFVHGFTSRHRGNAVDATADTRTTRADPVRVR